MIGPCARSGVARECLFLSCKVDLNSTEDPHMRMRRQVRNSLANLHTDYLDSVIFHWPICLDDANADHAAVRRASWKVRECLCVSALL